MFMLNVDEIIRLAKGHAQLRKVFRGQSAVN